MYVWTWCIVMAVSVKYSSFLGFFGVEFLLGYVLVESPLLKVFSLDSLRLWCEIVALHVHVERTPVLARLEPWVSVAALFLYRCACLELVLALAASFILRSPPGLSPHT